MKLKPLSKEEALASLKQFRKDLGLGKHADKDHIREILKRSGPLSE
jgi:hypothetical protein